jgi:hypothetical protein
MLGFEIGPTISRLLLAIIAVDVHHLLRNSCHFAFANFIGLINHSALRRRVRIHAEVVKKSD